MQHILDYLKAHVSPARYKHTLGTVKVSRALAERYGVSVEKAALAALLHDTGKSMPAADMPRFVSRHRIAVPLQDEVSAHSPALLHSYISAHIARNIFDITDKDILHAITAHTIGAAVMSPLAKILYVADSLSPDRRYPALKRIRALAISNLDAAVSAVMVNKMQYVVLKKKWLHPHAVIAWNTIHRESL
ncbi:MAG: bis(5'-nucleosyl)-tetraphosphatase (symmetrical) YqeK [Elusimicrobiota bacterium]